MSEEWIRVKGFEGYEVSSFGGVRKADTKVLLKRHESCNRFRVSLKHPVRGYGSYLVHRIVACSFFDEADSLSYPKKVIHKDGNTKNNFLENLEFVDIEGLIQHTQDIGRTSPTLRLYDDTTKTVYRSTHAAGIGIKLCSPVQVPKWARKEGILFETNGHMLFVISEETYQKVSNTDNS